MLNNVTKVTNIAGSSMVNEKLAVTMRATIGDNGTWNISKNIHDSELYLSNQKTCDADYAEFEAEVLKIAQA